MPPYVQACLLRSSYREPQQNEEPQGSQQLWVEPAKPYTASEVRKFSNWLRKIVRLAATGDHNAMEWAMEQDITEQEPLPNSIWIPQYFHETEKDKTHLGSFDYKQPYVRFDWKEFWQHIAQWKNTEPNIAGTRASGPDPPDSCFCTHDGVSDPRVEGANMYFLVLIWQDPRGAEHFLLGAKCNAKGTKPSFKAPFTAPTQQTYRTGDVAKTSVHFTSGPEARSGSGGKPRAQTQLPSGGYKQEPGMACKRIEILAQRPTRTVPRNSDTDWPQGMPTYLNHVPMAPTPGTSSAAPVVAWSQPDASGWRTPLHQLPGASWPQTDTNQGTTLDDASVTEPGADTRQQPERTDDATGAGQGCATNFKLLLAIFYIYTYIYICIEYTAGYFRHA